MFRIGTAIVLGLCAAVAVGVTRNLTTRRMASTINLVLELAV
jgi:hypothetical protein